MIYLNEEHIKKIWINWEEAIDVIEDSVKCLAKNDYAQPIKPYLRYRDFNNRIIAMPAFLGGSINMAGIKWIASFPGNIKKNIPRAHSVTILNNPDTGEPTAIINTALISVIRTASVSGLMIRYFQNIRQLKKIQVGIVGFGPIGQYHLKMCSSLLGNRIDHIVLFDINNIDLNLIDKEIRDKIIIADSWQKAYENADIFITCTVSKSSYINEKPKTGSLHLNVSLRDYKICVYKWFKSAIIVDDWEEVCREKTDIENMHLEKGLNKAQTFSICDIVMNNLYEPFINKNPILFNPMGMAVFDIAMGAYYYNLALKNLIGQDLNMFN
ncbi:MAG: 2,3-diaminopropionate biosynthesis protein SbnB [Bacteroidetes bacterium GWF2_33_16]|nr:MAG: 2,3-diaminopropionate biosynthesis protein SbnB [Bacteroidetes bacterium GWE2_32_14]OFY02338.1 MAG: 2,3-diaminopropionate biosynthesis protein SbnB [Bacteroidetes bacterium GWF2_33_16]